MADGDGDGDMMMMMLMNKVWNDVASSNSLWRRFVQSLPRDDDEMQKPGRWKQRYMEDIKLQRESYLKYCRRRVAGASSTLPLNKPR